ncbi:MAG: OmpH family outer membrane protein [Bacteroidota bacterium]
MNRIAIKSLLVIAVLAFSSQISIAQKVGFLSTNEVLLGMTEVKQANSKLEILEAQLSKQGDAMIQKAQNKLVKAQEDYQKGLLTAQDVARLESELLKEEQEIQKFGSSAQEDLAKKRQELFEPILVKIDEAIQEIVTEDGLSYVFDASIGALLYADDSLDITDKVKAKLGM